MKYLKCFNLFLLIGLAGLLILQCQFIYEYIAEKDIAWRSEIGLVISMIAVGAVAIAIPSIIYRQKDSKISNLLLAFGLLHCLIFLVFLYV